MRHVFVSFRPLLLACAMASGFAPSARASDFNAEKVLSELKDLLRTSYFDAKVADAVVAKLDSDAAQLEKQTDRSAFAKAIAEDMASVAHDAHLRLLDKPDAIPESVSSPQAAAEMDRARNYGIASVSILPGNIGCLTLSGFARFTPETAQRLSWAFGMLANSYGLVIDVTNSRGGDPATESNIIRYLTAADITLDTAIMRDGTRLPTVTPKTVLGPEYGPTRPVAVAVSGKTISAAEALPYDLQALKRARIFGERTRGGANPSQFKSLSDGFIALMPMAHTVNPITHTSWEGTGVVPDEAVQSDKAVETGRIHLINILLAGEKDETRRAILMRGLAS